MNTQKTFSNPLSSILFALLTCALWGSLFLFIKLGYSAFHIDSGDVPSILLFAGLRFTVSGIIMIALFSAMKKKALIPQKKDILPILVVSLFTIILHYFFTYMALSVGEGSKSAIIKQVGFLFLSCLSFLFIKSEHFSWKKLLCGLLGFFGIIVTNMDGGAFSFALGDALLIAASVCSVVGAVITKKTVQRTDPLILVTYSQLIGGALLCTLGLPLGGRITHVDLRATATFVYICAASIGAYAIWNVLVKYNALSKLSVIKFTEPLFAVIFSGLFLHENIMKWNYLIALVFMLTAILLDNGFVGKHKTNEKVIRNESNNF